MFKSCIFQVLAALAACALAARPIIAQELPRLATPEQGESQERSQGQEQDQNPVETLKVNVRVVQLFFNVKDKKGALIPNLTKDDFNVSEDGKAQTIKYFSAESNQPLTLGILIDCSASQMRVLPMEQQVGAAFLHDVLRPKDLAFLISFDVNVEL